MKMGLHQQFWSAGQKAPSCDNLIKLAFHVAINTKMDPWCCQKSENGTNSSQTDDIFKRFEDDFHPVINNELPDSDKYLAILEEKLNKIRSDPNVLKQLAEKREACMRQLLSFPDATKFDDVLSLDEPVADSPILRTVLPQKQALTQGEVLELVKYDQLLNEDSESSESSSNNT